MTPYEKEERREARYYGNKVAVSLQAAVHDYREANLWRSLAETSEDPAKWRLALVERIAFWETRADRSSSEAYRYARKAWAHAIASKTLTRGTV